MEARYKCRNIIITTYGYSKLGRLEEKPRQQKQQEARNQEKEPQNSQPSKFAISCSSHCQFNKTKPCHKSMAIANVKARK
jgi:hypothetical protein